MCVFLSFLYKKFGFLGLYEYFCSMKMMLYVALGGAIGSVLRSLIGKAFVTSFPFGTLLVNVLGCLLIGFLYGMFGKYTMISSEMKALLTVGLCGGFTTFSTFINECNKLVSLGDYINAAIYLAISIIFGFAAVYFGQRIWN